MFTYRVLYVPRPGVRLLIEDVEADALVQTDAGSNSPVGILELLEAGGQPPLRTRVIAAGGW